MKIRCTNCAVEYSLKPSKVNRIKNPCCSVSCAAKLRSVMFTGEGNHQFGLKGSLNPTYKSDIRVNQHGYMQIRAVFHPFKDSGNWCFLHRLVMEQYLKDTGRVDILEPVDGYSELYLGKNYIVHHIDGDKTNNVIANLKIMTLAEHSRLHYPEKCIERNPENGQYISGKKLKPGVLKKQHILDAGLDIVSSESLEIDAFSSALIGTDLIIAIPEGCVGLIWSRSGLAVKHGIEVGAGCIDSGYTGEVKVLLRNFSQESYVVNKGDRIAQLLTIPVNLNNYVVVEEFSKKTERNAGGFGSTGG